MTLEDGTIIYRVYVRRDNKSILVGSTGLETIKLIHGDDIIQTNHSSKTVFLNPKTTPYGK